MLGGNVASSHFAHDEFVVEEAVFAQLFGVRLHAGGHKVGIFVAEGEYAAGFDADKGCFLADDVAQALHIV